MSKLEIFLDYANINRSADEKGITIDYRKLLLYFQADRFLVDAHCYVPLDPRQEHKQDRAIEELWRSGYIVTTKIGTIAGETYKCNVDVEITMDVLRIASHVRPDIIVLATGDGDFTPLVTELRRIGIRTEIACFEGNASRQLILKCSGFINLDLCTEEILESRA